MNVIDMVVTAVLVVNAILGAVRGFALQAFRLGSIVLAIWLARTLADDFADVLAPHLAWPRLQLVSLGWVAVGGATYLGTLGIGHFAKDLIQRLRMGGADRALGTLLGGLKGLLWAAVGLHILTAVISAGAYVAPAALKSELEGSRAFEFYLKAVWPMSNDWVNQARARIDGGTPPPPERPR
jgi:uncharacterized membrane protein required for colicin V production